MEFILRNEAGEVATTGYTVQLMLDADRNLLMLLPPFYREFLDRWRKGALA
jgi:acyl-CoA thioester hydrolase